MLIIDAHEDIAWNILTFGRDYTQNIQHIRDQEQNTSTPIHNGNTLLGKDAWLTGEIGLIFATLYVSPARRRIGDWDTLFYSSQSEAASIASRQLDAYHRLCEVDPTFRMVFNQRDLGDVLASWPRKSEEHGNIGLVLLMEGADPIIEPEMLQEWYQRGLRILGLSWEATRYAGGTHEPGPLTEDGRRLLGYMEEYGMILDLSHLSEEAYYQSLDSYSGPVIASHANPRKFLPTTRGLSDDMLKNLFAHDGVVGIVPYNKFLDQRWGNDDARDTVSLQLVADVIDHICQLAGNTDHVGIGSDFDGGFGWEHVPHEINSIADFQKLIPILIARGFQEKQIKAILHDNWLRKLKGALPE
jgi:membrane dipeptidase